MNIERLRQVQQWLASKESLTQFDMGAWISNDEEADDWCGTTCCIAGYCMTQIYPSYEKWRETSDDLPMEAAEWLGLDRTVSLDLFLPRYHIMRQTTNAMAIAAIENVINFGEPRWQQVYDDEQKKT